MCGEASAPPASDSTDIGRVSLASFGVIEDIAEMPGDTQQKDVDITVAESLPKGPEIRADAPDFILDVVERLLNDLGRQ